MYSDECTKEMCKHILTWKKEVWEGSSPVFPGGTTTSTGATSPTRAGAPTYKGVIRHVKVSLIYMQRSNVNRSSMLEVLSRKVNTYSANVTSR
jgi:hypothetical protein